MRKLKQLGLATMLVLALSTFTMAGIIETPPAPTPPPPSSAPGIIETPPRSALDPIEIVLGILQSVLL